MYYHNITGLAPNENTISFSTVLILAGMMKLPLIKFMPTGSQQGKMTLLKGTTAVSYQASGIAQLQKSSFQMKSSNSSVETLFSSRL